MLGSCALLLSAAATIAAWWHFRALMLAVLAIASTAPLDTLRQLAPDAVFEHNRYRIAFSFIVMFSAALWQPALRLVGRGHSINPSLVAGGAIVLCIALGMLHAPYRLLYHNAVFEAVSWNGGRCYILGERAGDVLLFCPLAQPPRNRIIPNGDSALQRLGVRESVFTPLTGSPTR